VAHFYFWSIHDALSARDIARKDPAVWKIPIELSDRAVSSSPGTQLSYLGYDFEVPWTDMDAQRMRRRRDMQIMVFHSGKLILFRTSPPGKSVGTFAAKNCSDRWRNLLVGLSPEVLSSDYAFTRAALEATPAHTDRDAITGRGMRLFTLLLMKSVLILPDEDEVFSLKTDNFEGFEFRSADARPRNRFRVVLFGKRGEVEFDFVESRRGNKITQAEINHVIQSVRRSSADLTAAGQ